MHHISDQPGFEDAILNSDNDYEPYGYGTPSLEPIETAPENQIRNPAHQRVIEAELLRQCSLVDHG